MNHGLPPQDWDTKLQRQGGHVMQSRAWALFQQQLGRMVVFDQTEEAMWSGSLVQGRGVRYLYVPYGPTMWPLDEHATNEVLSSLRNAGQQCQVDFVRFEPIGSVAREDLEAVGAHYFGEVQPQWTSVVALSDSKATLRAALSKANKNLINRAAREGVAIEVAQLSQFTPIFLAMLDDTAHHGSFRPQSHSYLQTQFEALCSAGAGLAYLGYHRRQPVAAAFVYLFGDTWYYAHAAAFQEQNRQCNVARPLVWRALMDAKSQKAKWFDFYGVAPPGQPNHPWAGISQFKRSFGGHDVQRLGTWDLPIKPAKYQLYRWAKKLVPL